MVVAVVAVSVNIAVDLTTDVHMLVRWGIALLAALAAQFFVSRLRPAERAVSETWSGRRNFVRRG